MRRASCHGRQWRVQSRSNVGLPLSSPPKRTARSRLRPRRFFYAQDAPQAATCTSTCAKRTTSAGSHSRSSRACTISPSNEVGKRSDALQVFCREIDPTELRRRGPLRLERFALLPSNPHLWRRHRDASLHVGMEAAKIVDGLRLIEGDASGLLNREHHLPTALDGCRVRERVLVHPFDSVANLGADLRRRKCHLRDRHRDRFGMRREHVKRAKQDGRTPTAVGRKS